MRLSEAEKDITGTFPVPDDPDGATVNIRLLKPGERTEIFDQSQNVEYKVEDQNMVPSVKYKATLERELKYLKVLTGWGNVFEDEEGKVPLPCNDETKRRMAHNVEGFQAFVLKCHDQLAEDHRAKTEHLEKN